MGKIIRLDQKTTNLIAAGEVVERAASVVKELVENAIDAKAKNIDIKLHDAGVLEIFVRDDGEGMDAADAKMAIEPHATSKIASGNDLFRIKTLGFRGEALPSIVAVSNFKLRTSNDGIKGIMYSLRGGEFLSEATVAQPKGTEITVKNLFFNTPARLQNLQSQAVELSFIVDYVTKMAIAAPHIAFTLTNNERSLIQTYGNDDVLEVVMACYGSSIAKEMIAIAHQDGLFSIRGYVSSLKVSRSTRHHIHIIVNGRVIKNNKLVQAVIKAYQERLVVGRYPIAIVEIEVDPGLVDVNVHPAKTEVRFSNEIQLANLITDTIDNTLYKTNLIVDMDTSDVEEKYNVPHVQDSEEARVLKEEIVDISSLQKPIDAKEILENTVEKQIFQQQHYRFTDNSFENLDMDVQLPRMSYIGQLFGTYILAQTEGTFYLIDQHAAAERINYEKILLSLQKENNETYDLLLPFQLDFSPSEAILIEDKISQFMQLGIGIERFGNNTFMIRMIPSWILEGQEQTFIEEIITHIIQDKKQEKFQFLSNLAKSLACKKSIKANEYHSVLEVTHLLDALGNTKNPFTCPHGRPTIVKFSQQEIEKWFKRII